MSHTTAHSWEIGSAHCSSCAPLHLWCRLPGNSSSRAFQNSGAQSRASVPESALFQLWVAQLAHFINNLTKFRHIWIGWNKSPTRRAHANMVPTKMPQNPSFRSRIYVIVFYSGIPRGWFVNVSNLQLNQILQYRISSEIRRYAVFSTTVTHSFWR